MPDPPIPPAFPARVRHCRLSYCPWHLAVWWDSSQLSTFVLIFLMVFSTFLDDIFWPYLPPQVANNRNRSWTLGGWHSIWTFAEKSPKKVAEPYKDVPFGPPGCRCHWMALAPC